MQAVGIITDAERAVGLDIDNPVLPIILVVGGSLFLGYGFDGTHSLCLKAVIGCILNRWNFRKLWKD